jgi:hypothetical protein
MSLVLIKGKMLSRKFEMANCIFHHSLLFHAHRFSHIVISCTSTVVLLAVLLVIGSSIISAVVVLVWSSVVCFCIVIISHYRQLNFWSSVVDCSIYHHHRQSVVLFVILGSLLGWLLRSVITVTVPKSVIYGFGRL